MPKQKRKSPKIKYIPYGPEGKGPFWRIVVSKAKQNVTVNGSVLDALRGFPGTTIGCALSNTAVRNKTEFGHPVYFACFTPTKAILIDKIKRGTPVHGVEYDHSYRHLTDKNDNRTLKGLVRENPEIMERPFTLRVPRERKYHAGTNNGGAPRPKGHGKLSVHRGALNRAIKAGFVSKPVAQQMREVAKATSNA